MVNNTFLQNLLPARGEGLVDNEFTRLAWSVGCEIVTGDLFTSGTSLMM